jgi:hypothetical protein
VCTSVHHAARKRDTATSAHNGGQRVMEDAGSIYSHDTIVCSGSARYREDTKEPIRSNNIVRLRAATNRLGSGLGSGLVRVRTMALSTSFTPTRYCSVTFPPAFTMACTEAKGRLEVQFTVWLMPADANQPTLAASSSPPMYTLSNTSEA